MINKKPFKYTVAVCLFTLPSILPGAATACTIGEEAQVQFPFNTTELSNSDRISIANSVIEAKKWPDVEIQAVVISGAYIREKDVDQLKNERAENAKYYLQQLGIDAKNILIDKKTFTDEMIVKQPDGAIDVHQMIVELTPICKGSCAWMCDDPRVTPHSKTIN
ncbi:hypothetical protein B7L17_006190 [Burkholderia cenocepacia]|uniref:hypothetical protein n=1 Tax=Burkholderia cenocepacia TaxID=95486 RepID=UPI0022371A86|nr:hypothetical protein [Burkholderia cenocepacia]MCW5118010.1 hypothetical protein [Burkholderia cenocepacia]MCW5129847.1 hypothetical protein [Burkholderia cenocepacia]MCW5173542.1 hypothetical protein [Burkholderia cenocepacia]